MIRGLYQAGNALESAQLNQEVLAENLAHAGTPGYRRQAMSYAAMQRIAAAQTADPAAPNSTPPTGIYTSFAPGPVQHTGNPLDLALSGDAFFTLEGPDGPVYTRSGAFEVNAQGELQNKGGLRVKGTGARISIPPNAVRIVVGQDGAVLVDGAEVGRLQLARFANSNLLRRVGTTLFEGPPPQTPEPGSVRVEQGYREGSNVQVVNEMVAMMIGMRQYEAAERAMRALGDAIGQNTRPQT